MFKSLLFFHLQIVKSSSQSFYIEKKDYFCKKTEVIMRITPYSKSDTSIFKGFAILSICLHNFFHHIANSPGENEFYFFSYCIDGFLHLLKTHPADFINIIYSYLGHFGVQLFIFISGYGLTKAMQKKEKSWGQFMVDRMKKLYPLVITALIVYSLSMIILHNKYVWNSDLTEMSYKIGFIHTLLPNSGLSLCGPWWFFGLIFQLYLIFPILYRLIKKHQVKSLIIILLISYTWIFLSMYQFQGIKNISLMQNSPGHLPEFCLGMFFAFSENKKFSNIFLPVSIIAFILGNFYKVFFPFTFIAITIIAIFAFDYIKRIPYKTGILKKIFVYFGNISMMMFVTNGFLRSPFIKLSEVMNTPLGHIVAALLFLTTVCGVSIASMKLYELLLSAFSKINIPTNRISVSVSRIFQLFFVTISIYILYYFSCFISPKNEKELLTKEMYVANKEIMENDTYTTVTSINFDKNYKKLKIEGSLDISNYDTSKDFPLLILDINGKLWHKYVIPKELNTQNGKKFIFSYEYYTPFIETLKGGYLKMYFWNTTKTHSQFNNTNLSIKY